jgi:tRNA-Thr(GGU) m(6)t(6)A37 methyltransferase TsaA
LQLLCLIAASVAAITPARPRVAIVGAGVSGLNCARKLQPNCDVTVFEAADGVGGRVRSDRERGYVFDRGFAVFLEAYEESREALDYDALRLRPFQPGALVCRDGEQQFVGDPLRRPQDLLPSLRAPVGSLADKLRAGLLRTACLAPDAARIRNGTWTRSSKSARDFLSEKVGVGPRLLDAFFEPFFRGVFLSRLDEQDPRVWLLAFQALSAAPTSLPEDGIGAVAEQLAASVDVRLNAKVDAVRDGSVDVNGETLHFDRVVVAVDGPALPKLLPDLKPVQARASTCVYFSLDAKDLPTELPIILLIPGDDGPLNNVCFPSNVQASYAPEGRALCSATIIDSLTDVTDPEGAAQKHLMKLFPDANVGSWTFERLYRVPFAQPRQQLDKPDLEGSPAYSDSIYVCGDHLTDPSLNGALASGRRAAAACLKSLRVRGGATPPLRDYATKFEAPSSVTYAPIGVVRSPYVERHGTPRQATVGDDAATGVIALNPEFRGSLKSLDGFDYVWVLAHMHLQTGKLRRFQIKPPRGGERHGVFATRAPHRPSPISLSALRLVAVDEEKLELTVQGLDLLDGTPVLDVKPYVPYCDAFPDARAGWVDELDDEQDGRRGDDENV